LEGDGESDDFDLSEEENIREAWYSRDDSVQSPSVHKDVMEKEK